LAFIPPREHRKILGGGSGRGGVTGNEDAVSLTFKSRVNCKIKALNCLSELLGFKVQKQAPNHGLRDLATDILKGRKRLENFRKSERIAERKRKEKEQSDLPDQGGTDVS